LRDAISMIIAMIRTAATPLITALQNNALIGSKRREVQGRPDKSRHRDRTVERWSAAGTLPAKRLA